MNSQVFKLAHKTKAQFSSWSEALSSAWKTIKAIAAKAKQLKSLLRTGTVHFTFIKKNGELREAFGTTNLEQPTERSSSSRKSPWYIVKFFDTVKNGWRSCDIRTLQNIFQ